MHPKFAYARGRWDAQHKFAADNTSMAFINNSTQGNSSNVDAPYINACLDGTVNNLGGHSLAVKDQGGIDATEEFRQVDQAALGAKAAAETFKVAPPPKPAAPTPAGRSAASPVPKPVAPVQPVKSAIPPTSPIAAPLPPSSAQAVATAVGGAQLQQAMQQPMKLISPVAKLAGIADRDCLSGHLLRGQNKESSFRLGLFPDPKPKPGEIQPTNGHRELGTNFETAHYDRTVSRGFDALKSQKNLDMLNAGNEAAIGSPGV